MTSDALHDRAGPVAEADESPREGDPDDQRDDGGRPGDDAVDVEDLAREIRAGEGTPRPKNQNANRA